MSEEQRYREQRCGKELLGVKEERKLQRTVIEMRKEGSKSLTVIGHTEAREAGETFFISSRTARTEEARVTQSKQ